MERTRSLRHLFTTRPRRRALAALALACASIVSGGAVHAVPLIPDDLTVEGRLYDNGGAPINTTVDFKLEIVDDAGSCVFYREARTNVDLSSTDANVRGMFSLRLGATAPEFTGQPMATLFAPGSLVGDGCSVTATAGSHRKVRILVRYPGAASYETLSPDTTVTSVPVAKVAENALTLNGVGTSSLLVLDGTSGLTQPNLAALFTTDGYNKLMALVAGNSPQYLPQNAATPYAFNNQRLTNLADPTAAQDAATKHYVDANVGGKPLDQTAVGPMVGNGSTLLWDATANKWVAGQIDHSPTGTAGGALTGTYPNPSLAHDVVASANVQSAGVAVNRLLITDAVTGAGLTYAECTVLGQVYAWTMTGWACTNVAALSPVTSVAGKTGAVTLNAADVGGLGTVATKDYGTAAGQVPLLDASARLPAVDGSLLTQVDAFTLRGRALASTPPVTNQVLGWNGSTWLPVNPTAPGVTNIVAQSGLLGGTITSTGTLLVDVGTSAFKIVQLNASAQLPAVDASLLVNVEVGTRPVAVTAPTANQVLGWDATASKWSPQTPTTGTVTLVGGGTGLIGGSITSAGTLAVDVGTAASKIVQLNANAQLPAVDGSLLTNLTLGTRSVASVSPGTGQVMGWNGSTWLPVNQTAPGVMSLVAQNGILGGTITSAGTISVDVGTTASKIVQLNASAQLPALDASLLYNAQLGTRPVSVTAPGANQVLGWDASASQWRPQSVTTGTVTLVSGGAGLLGGPITTAGTLTVDVGTIASKIVQLNASAQLPAVDGSLLTSLTLGSRFVSTVSPTTGQVMGWNGSAWLPVDQTAPGVTNIVAQNGILGGTITSSGTISVDVGTTASKIVQLNASAQLPALDASLLYNAKLGTRAVATTNPTDTQVLGWNATISQWMPQSVSTGTVKLVGSGTGLLGGSITGVGTLTVDVGTTASKILQLNASGQIPAVDASLLYNVTLGSRPVSTTAPGVGNLLSWNGSYWMPTVPATAVTTIATGTGLTGGPITTTGTINVNVGIADQQIVRVEGTQVRLAVGNAGTPTYTFAGDNDTGVYHEDVDKIGFSTGGTTRAVINAQGFLGVGTSTPQAILDVFGSGTTSALLIPRGDNTTKPVAISGMLRYNNTSQLFEGAVNSAWTPIITSTGTAGQVQYATGTGTIAGNPGMIYTAGGGLNLSNTVAFTANGTSSFGGPSGFNGVVAQQVVDRGGSQTFDLSSGNIFISQSNCSNIQLNNIVQGASYTIIITDPGTSQCSFQAISGYTFRYLPPLEARVASSHTIYNLLVTPGTVYITWSTGFAP